jgi:hypothetical protein
MFLSAECDIPYLPSDDKPATDRGRGWPHSFQPLLAAVILLFRPLLPRCYLTVILLFLRPCKSPKA